MMSKTTSSNINWINIGGWAIIVIIIGVVGLAVLSSNSMQTELLESNLQLNDSDQIKGNLDSGVVIVEYGDYQCPFCATLHPIIETVYDEDPEAFAIVYRQFPLTSIHSNALPASKATESAGLQGKFWEMHNLIYRSQQTWSESTDVTPIFEQFALDLDLDLDRFKSDFNSDKVIQKINKDRRVAEDIGVSSTPTLFVNGVEVQSPSSIEAFRNIVASAQN